MTSIAMLVSRIVRSLHADFCSNQGPRRSFPTRSAVVFLFGSALGLVGCGDDDRTPVDAGAGDAGFDASVDASGSDAATEDAALEDAAALDADDVDAAADDAGPDVDAGPDEVDAGMDGGIDAGTDAGTDAGMVRRAVFLDLCPSGITEPGLYRGTLASNLNEVSSACGVSAGGGEGSLRVSVPVGETLRATYRHAGDGVVYLLDRCPVIPSCLVGRDATSSGAETLEWTNTDGTTNEVFLFLDSFELGGPQTFELDLVVE